MSKSLFSVHILSIIIETRLYFLSIIILTHRKVSIGIRAWVWLRKLGPLAQTVVHQLVRIWVRNLNKFFSGSSLKELLTFWQKVVSVAFGKRDSSSKMARKAIGFSNMSMHF